MIKSNTLTAPLGAIMFCGLCLSSVQLGIEQEIDFSSIETAYYNFDNNYSSANNLLALKYIEQGKRFEGQKEAIKLFGKQEGFTSLEWEKYNKVMQKDSVKIGINVFV